MRHGLSRIDTNTNGETGTCYELFDIYSNVFSLLVSLLGERSCRTNEDREPKGPTRFLVGIVRFLTNCRGSSSRVVGLARVEEAFDEVAGTRRRVNGRESRGFDVISCLRCVVAGVRYIGPNDRPRRAAVRDPHTQLPLFLFRSASLLILFRATPPAARLFAAFRHGCHHRIRQSHLETRNRTTRNPVHRCPSLSPVQFPFIPPFQTLEFFVFRQTGVLLSRGM